MQVAEAALDSWSKLNIAWHSFLSNGQKVVLTGDEVQKATSGDCYFLAEKVDVLLHWWSLQGQKHKLMCRIASCELAIPSSNSLQERVFSFCKIVDMPQRQNLGMEKFEMHFILSFNSTFIK